MPGVAAAYVAIAFGAGIVASEYAPLWLCAAASALVVLAAAGLRGRDSKSRPNEQGGRSNRPAGLVIVALAFVIGSWRYSLDRHIRPDDISRHIPRVSAMQGTVVSDPEGGEGRVRFVFRADSAKLPDGWRPGSGKVMVNLGRGSRVELDYGDCVRISVAPYLPRDPTNPGRFSWRGYLARNGIHACASVRSGSRVELMPRRGGNPLVALALRARHGLADSIASIHPPEESSVTIGMALGTYAYLPSSTFRNFSRTGTLHLLAASGFNCYVLLFLATPVLRLIRVVPRWRGAVVIVLILGYVLMVGGKPSLVRAGIMASLVLLARPLKRATDTTSLFFVAGLVILAINPGDLFDVGFQLSFLAVWAIIHVTPIIGGGSVLQWAGLAVKDPAAPPKRRHFVLRKFAGALGATAIATTAVTLVTAPVVAYYFNYFSLTSIPANMAVGLGVPVVFADGFLAPVAARVGWLGAVVGFIGTWTVRAMLAVVNELGGLRWSAVSVASPGPLAILGYYIILHAALAHLRSRNAS